MVNGTWHLIHQRSFARTPSPVPAFQFDERRFRRLKGLVRPDGHLKPQTPRLEITEGPPLLLFSCWFLFADGPLPHFSTRGDEIRSLLDFADSAGQQKSDAAANKSGRTRALSELSRCPDPADGAFQKSGTGEGRCCRPVQRALCSARFTDRDALPFRRSSCHPNRSR